jgi:hypothetical protein
VYEIAIINPRPKKRRKSGKQGASKMAKRKRKSRPAKKTAARRRPARRAVAAAPRRRRRAAGKRRPAVGYVVGAKRIRRRKLNPRRVSRSRRRSNPRFSVSGITNQIMPAVYGAGGALALDVALGYIPLPAVLTTGYARHGVRIVGALGIGWLASKFLRGKGQAIGAGALTVAVYGLLKEVAVGVTAGKVKGLGDYEEIEVSGYYDPAPQIGAYMTSPGIGAYMAGGSDDAAYDTMGAMDY